MVRFTLQSSGAVVAGLAVALALVIAVEGFSELFHPFPPDADKSDMDVCKAHVAIYPTWVLAAAGVGWVLTVFAASWTAARLGPGRHPMIGAIVGVLLLAAAGFNVAMLPYAGWFKLFCLLLLPTAAIFGVMLARKPAAT